MYLLDLSSCGASGILKVVYFMKLIINFALAILPIALIVLLMIDFSKMTISGDESQQNKTLKIAIKRVIYAIVVFLVPYIVSVFNGVLNTMDLGVNFMNCYNDLTIEAINALEASEIAAEESQKKAQTIANNNNNDNNNNNNDNNNNKENYVAAGKGCDGWIYYENGTFYIPTNKYKSGVSGTKGSAPYGYNKYFYDRLNEFIKAGAKEGHKITMSTTEYGAWRPIENQEYFYNCYKTKACNNGNFASVPGTSDHGWGISSDLGYSGNRSTAVKWAHDNANKFGLDFVNKSEDWHIEPAKRIYSDTAVEKCGKR